MKPKEFWVDARPHSGHIGRVDTCRHSAWSKPQIASGFQTFIHVIEKSAADKLEEALDKLLSALRPPTSPDNHWNREWIKRIDKALAEYRGQK